MKTLIYKFYHWLDRKIKQRQYRNNLGLMFIDSHGNEWYGFNSHRYIPPIRNHFANFYAEMSALTLTRNRMKTLATKAIEYNDKGLRSNVGVILNEFIMCAEHYNDLNVMRNLSACYLCLNDEEPHTYENDQHERKVKLLQEPETEAFFLTMYFKYMSLYKESWKERKIEVLRELERKINLAQQSTDRLSSNRSK